MFKKSFVVLYEIIDQPDGQTMINLSLLTWLLVSAKKLFNFFKDFDKEKLRVGFQPKKNVKSRVNRLEGLIMLLDPFFAPRKIIRFAGGLGRYFRALYRTMYIQPLSIAYR